MDNTEKRLVRLESMMESLQATMIRTETMVKAAINREQEVSTGRFCRYQSKLNGFESGFVSIAARN